MSYHNTTHSTGPDLIRYEAKAISQEDLIMNWFEAVGGRRTPSEIQSRLLPLAPITSVRRALTNLTNASKLVKTTEQRQGPFGRPEYCWRLPDTHQLKLL